MSKKPELLPTLEDHFETLDNNFPVSTVGLEHIYGAILAKTNLNEFNSKHILRLFFQEIRSSLLRKNKIDIRSLGTFYVSSPETSGTSKKIFVKFTPKKSLKNKINNNLK